MTRDEAIELLELMKRQQHEEAGAAPIDSEILAKAYVRMISRRGRDKDKGSNGDPAGEGGGVAC